MGKFFSDCGCGCNGRKQQEKFTASLMSALIFFLIANPETFIIVRRVFGNWVASATGYPTTLGLILHSVVFMLIVWGLMNLKREKEEGTMKPPPQAVPEGEATKDGKLPDEAAPSQPMGDMGMGDMGMGSGMVMGVSPPTPATSLLPSPNQPAMITDGTMSKMSNMLGGQDVMGENPMMSPAPAVYGSSWRQCPCGDGTQVMIMK